MGCHTIVLLSLKQAMHTQTSEVAIQVLSGWNVIDHKLYMLRSMYITFRVVDNCVGFASCLFCYLFHIFSATRICFHSNLFFFVFFFLCCQYALHFVYIQLLLRFFLCSLFVVYCTISKFPAITHHTHFFFFFFFFSFFPIL